MVGRICSRNRPRSAQEESMGKPRTYRPGEWITVLKDAGFDYLACGSYFMVLVGKYPKQS